MLYLSVNAFKNQLLIADTFIFLALGWSVYRLFCYYYYSVKIFLLF